MRVPDKDMDEDVGIHVSNKMKASLLQCLRNMRRRKQLPVVPDSP